ncbi:MAG: hypothetical protein PHX68_02945, partial [Alphaproteobacteria bacterium]|nr:hypothetical protein [Alphaproteobacteria bacterium]
QPSMTLEQIYQTRAAARDAFAELAQAREMARQLQLNQAAKTQKPSASAGKKSGVRGTISRASQP